MNIVCSLKYFVKSCIVIAGSVTVFVNLLANCVVSDIPTVSVGTVFVIPIALPLNSVTPTDSEIDLLICGIIFLTVDSVIPNVSYIDLNTPIGAENTLKSNTPTWNILVALFLISLAFWNILASNTPVWKTLPINDLSNAPWNISLSKMLLWNTLA